MMNGLLAVMLAVTAVTGAARAQVLAATHAFAAIPVANGRAGLTVHNGTVVAGEPCGHVVFSCTPDAIGASPGDLLTIRIAGAERAPYALLVSAGAGSCTTMPNLLNALLLDDPVVISLMGTLDEVNPVPACPPARETLVGVMPVLPVGFRFAIQAVTMGAGWITAFTGAVEIAVV